MGRAAMDVTEALATLGLGGSALDRQSVDRAWRRFARSHHPDMCPGDPGACRRFAQGREAYEALRVLPAAATPAGAGMPLPHLLQRGVIPAPVARRRARAYVPPELPRHEWVA